MIEATPGIYEIVNTINGKRYVGSAVSLRRRWNKHRRDLAAGKHHSAKLQRAWAKFGEAAFEFRCLAPCAVVDLLRFEQAALDRLRPVYNMSPTAGSCLGLKHGSAAAARHSAASKGRKMSDSAKAVIAAAHTGRKHPPEFGAAISARNKGAPRPKSAEYRQKISEALMGHRYNAGITKSPAHRAKLSEIRRGVPNLKNRGNKSRTGMKTTPEVVARQVASLRAYWARKKESA